MGFNSGFKGFIVVRIGHKQKTRYMKMYKHVGILSYEG